MLWQLLLMLLLGMSTCSKAEVDGLWENDCHRYLRELASAQKDFVYCVTVNAVPVSLCMSCLAPYTVMDTAYSNLKDDGNCTQKYFDKDRINVVQTTQSILIGLWNKAYCSDCFSSNNSLNFNQKSLILENCINNKLNKGRECKACLTRYEDLNDFYNKLDVNHLGNICYDIQDSMNRTRALWSDQLHCCQRIFNINLFLIAISIVAVLPIVFYSSAYWFTKRQERNHGVITAADAETSSTSQLITAENSIDTANSPIT